MEASEEGIEVIRMAGMFSAALGITRAFGPGNGCADRFRIGVLPVPGALTH